MGDFIECRYAVGCPESAMIGLSQDKDVPYWMSQLGTACASDHLASTPKLGITAHPTASQVILDLTDEWQSTHRRTDGSMIVLKHIFLDCRTLPI